MKILVIGDTHFKENLSYADHISDRRIGEKKEVLDFIVKSSVDCDSVILMGDCFDSKNPSAKTIKDFVSFVESFGKKDVYILSGNHSKKGDGSTAIDFLKEIKGKKWHIFTKPGTVMMGNKKVDFLPYMLKSELEVETNEEAAEKMMKMLKGGDILFAHHAISGTTFNGIKVETFQEPILPKEKLEKKYQKVVAGHIHSPKTYGRTLVTGSVFTDTVGEIEKFIYIIKEDLSITEILKLPNRAIYKLEDPVDKVWITMKKDSIVKVIITDKETNIEEIRAKMAKFDASLLIEDYPQKRKKMHIEEGAFDFSIETLLKLYAKEKEIDYQKLLAGLSLIN